MENAHGEGSLTMPRESVLHKVRTALARKVGQPPAPAPPPRLSIPELEPQARWERFARALEKLGGKAQRVSSPAEAGRAVAALIGDRPAVASEAPYLAECGITRLPSVQSGFRDPAALRAACAAAEFGITSADYALADTGTLVIASSPREPRLISLLPPVHVAVLPAERLLTGLDELLALAPAPAERTSALVLITGPSRTADIEQILVRGVHGPGQIHVIVVDGRETTG